MEKYKTIVGLLCFLIFVQSSVFCYGPGLAPFLDLPDQYHGTRRNSIDEPSSYQFMHNLSTENGAGARLKRSRQCWMQEFPLACMADLIESYRHSTWLSSPVPNLPSPFTEVLVKKVVNNANANIEIPYYLKATIRYNNIPQAQPSATQSAPQRLQRPPMRSNVAKQKDNMGGLPKTSPDGPYDERGHLLAYSLGGGMHNLWNYVPQLNRLNRHTPEGGPSLWRGEEDCMREFLINNQQSGRIDWNLVVVYDLSDSNNYRPLGFILQYNTTNNLGARTVSKVMNFSNLPDSECFYEECELTTN